MRLRLRRKVCGVLALDGRSFVLLMGNGSEGAEAKRVFSIVPLQPQRCAPTVVFEFLGSEEMEVYFLCDDQGWEICM
jgi:hypothetical protein